MSFSRSAPCLLERGTLFSRYVTLVVYQRGKIIRRPAGRCNCISSRASHRAARISPSRLGLDSPGSPTSKRGRLIIGLSFSLTLSPVRRPPTFHPVPPVCRRAYFCTMVYRDRAIMTMPDVIGCPSSAEPIWNIVRNASSRIVVSDSVLHDHRMSLLNFRFAIMGVKDI